MKMFIKVLVSILIIAGVILLSFFFVAPTITMVNRYKIELTELRITNIELPRKNSFGGYLGFDQKIHRWSSVSWKYKHKNKDFFVYYYNHSFYDDYQIEDFEKWSLEYLDNNTSENIFAVQIGEINHFNQSFLSPYKNKYISKNDYWESLNNKQTEFDLFYKIDNVSSFTERDKASVILKLKNNQQLMNLLNKNSRIFLIDTSSRLGRNISLPDYKNVSKGVPVLIRHYYYGIDQDTYNSLYLYDDSQKLTIYINDIY